MKHCVPGLQLLMVGHEAGTGHTAVTQLFDERDMFSHCCGMYRGCRCEPDREQEIAVADACSVPQTSDQLNCVCLLSIPGVPVHQL